MQLNVIREKKVKTFNFIFIIITVRFVNQIIQHRLKEIGFHEILI